MPLNRTEQNIGQIITVFAIILFAVYLILSTVGLRSEIILLGILVPVVIATIVLSIVVTRNLRKAGKNLEVDYINVGVQRYLLGLFMIFYGLPKLFGTFFDYQLFALDSKLKDISEFELAWYFYGKNRWQELFAGIMEFVPGVLLLSRRTYYLGALVLLPVTGQVFILNFFFKIGGITFPAAAILLACNLYIVYSQRESIVRFFRSLNFSPALQLGAFANTTIKAGKWIVIILALLVVYRNVKRNFFAGNDGTNYKKLVGAYSLDAMTKNGKPYVSSVDSLVYKDLYIERQSRWNILRRSDNETDAFVMKLNPANDSISIFINKGGIGDGADILDSLTVITGTYKLDNKALRITGIQLGDTVDLTYVKKDVEPKKWFW